MVIPVVALHSGVLVHRRTRDRLLPFQVAMGTKIFPNDAYFYWVIGYDDIDSFRWLIRTIKGERAGHRRATNSGFFGPPPSL